jgi:hypothetical protein
MSRLDEAVAEIGKRYRCVIGTACAFSPTMEEYVVIKGDGLATAAEAIAALSAAIATYCDGKVGTLYWRVVPEIEMRDGAWKYYARLLVTDKPPLTWELWHGDDDREPMMSRAEWSRRYFPPPTEAAPAA